MASVKARRGTSGDGRDCGARALAFADRAGRVSSPGPGLFARGTQPCVAPPGGTQPRVAPSRTPLCAWHPARRDAGRRLAGCQAQSEAAGRSLASRRLAGCQAQSGVRAGKKNAALPGRGYSACWCAVPAARRGMPVYWAPARAVALGPSCVMEHSDLASGLFRGWRAELHGLGT
jgi:hypothetical protein